MNYGFANIYWRDMIRFVRFKTLLVSSLLQPALWLAFFGITMSSSFDSLMAGMPVVPGVHQVGYLTFMGAGIIAMTTLFTSLFGGIQVHVPQLALYPEIMNLSRIEEYFPFVKIKIIVFNTEFHLSLVFCHASRVTCHDFS